MNSPISFECFSCRKVMLLTAKNADSEQSPSCGSTNGRVISRERLEEGMKAGVYFSIDPSTGKRSKGNK